jgi:diacylglycerol kinase family enzyme
MTDQSTPTATALRRLSASSALALIAIGAAVVVLSVVGDLRRLPLELVLLAALVLAAWFALTRTRWSRLIAALTGVGAVAGLVTVSFGGFDLLSVLVRVALLLLALTVVRMSVARDTRNLQRAPTSGRAVPAARYGVLLINPGSGGGKAERFRLAQLCSARDIEPVELRPGDDLVDLAEAAVARGADVIGMAGGDGSQALVADVAARNDIALVVVPTGTRNHLALDLGLDRDDVVGALDAFGAAVERPVDLAQVNGRTFVNNVSLGLYAAIVRSPEYRDAKIETSLNTLPQVLGRGSRPFDLRFTGPAGQPHVGAHVVQVSNNPYGRTAGTRANRPALDTARLGVIALEIKDDRAAAAFLAAAGAGRPERFGGFDAWEPETFEVTSAGPIDMGLDGEAVQMASPLLFTLRPHALRVRLPERAVGLSPAARDLHTRTRLQELRRTASARPGGGT